MNGERHLVAVTFQTQNTSNRTRQRSEMLVLLDGMLLPLFHHYQLVNQMQDGQWGKEKLAALLWCFSSATNLSRYLKIHAKSFYSHLHPMRYFILVTYTTSISMYLSVEVDNCFWNTICLNLYELNKSMFQQYTVISKQEHIFINLRF